jgi:hypothetical protein
MRGHVRRFEERRLGLKTGLRFGERTQRGKAVVIDRAVKEFGVLASCLVRTEYLLGVAKPNHIVIIARGIIFDCIIRRLRVRIIGRDGTKEDDRGRSPGGFGVTGVAGKVNNLVGSLV